MKIKETYCKSLWIQLLILVSVVGMFLCSTFTYAEDAGEWMPDPNLRKAVQLEMGVPEGVPIAPEDITKVIRLNVASMDITDLTGLERFINLEKLFAHHNRIENLRPLARLTNLGDLHLSHNNIEDLRPLAGLTNLKTLTLNYNNIPDVSPLAGLVNLEKLELWYNQIRDISPLANLVKLKTLLLNNNRIEDISPLVALTGLKQLSVGNNWIVDLLPLEELPNTEILDSENNPGSIVGECELPKPSVIPRIQDRTYPSVSGSWGSIRNRPLILPKLPWHEAHEAIAYFDIYFCCPEVPLNLKFKNTNAGVYLIGDFQAAKARRDAILAFNPNAILLVPVIYYSSVQPHEYPDDWPLWLKDENGNRIIDIWGDALVDFTLPETQKWAIDQAKTIAACGLFDGIFFDHWDEGQRLHGLRPLEAEHVARDNILQGIRDAVDDDFLIMVNTTEEKIPRWAEYINGTFMQTYPVLEIPREDITDSRQIIPIGYTLVDIFEIEQILIWAETHFREPRINVLSGEGVIKEPPEFPRNKQWMRLFTTMSLTLSDGYVDFDSPVDSGGDVYWYDFWDTDLGTPIGEKAQPYENRDGLYIREYTNGWAVYNRTGNAQEIQLPGKATGVASGITSFKHTVPDLDGEMFLKTGVDADVNGDGVVNIQDLVIVANAFGEAEPDVNGDGVVNIQDLVIVANAF
ncbi:MAG: leucine-rich repeat domain-containing protein [Candidatus Poribacteria bacterium]|nr:leucine-rich repeat domain-containing protein [Candidatus Poribacteria bacterium]